MALVCGCHTKWVYQGAHAEMTQTIYPTSRMCHQNSYLYKPYSYRGEHGGVLGLPKTYQASQSFLQNHYDCKTERHSESTKPPQKFQGVSPTPPK